MDLPFGNHGKKLDLTVYLGEQVFFEKCPYLLAKMLTGRGKLSGVSRNGPRTYFIPPKFRCHPQARINRVNYHPIMSLTTSL